MKILELFCGSKSVGKVFEKYKNIWNHGDFASITNNRGFIIYGRSDTTLNPGGVRLGTSEIYSVVEKFKEVEESIVIGQSWKNDIRIILFIVILVRQSYLRKTLQKE